MTAESTSHPARSLPAFPTHLVREQLKFALLVYAGFVLFILVLILGVAYWRDIEVSGWDQATQAVRLYAFLIAIYVGYSLLPLHVTHGQTRRDFAAQAAMFMAVFVTALALMVTVGFVLERGLYGIGDWPQAVEDDRLYASASQLHLIFLEAWLIQGLWFAGGLFIGSAWYRAPALGGLALGIGLVCVAISGVAFSSDPGPWGQAFEWLAGDEVVGAVPGVIVYMACIGTLLLGGWLVTRDLPIRNKTA